MGETPLSRDEADRALGRLRAEADRIAESLVAMDGHPAHRLLRGVVLTGLTERRWAEASTEMAALWEQFAAYREMLERAEGVRQRRSRPGDEELAELTWLLSGPVVELDAEHVPIERRGLTGPAMVTERITLGELVGRMKAAFGTVTEVLAATEAAWAKGIGRLEPLEQELAEVRVLAGSVAPADAAAAGVLQRVGDGVAEVRARLLTDVLGVHADDPQPGLAAELSRLRERLDRLSAVRDTWAERLAVLGGGLSDIETAEADARSTYAVVTVKIAAHGLPEPACDRAAALRIRLDEARERGESGEWALLAALLDELETGTAEALAAARREQRALSGLLDRRAELRGRLEAYRAKAARLGHAEDLALTDLHDEAHGLLHTAPCDLPAATRALNRYQQAIRRLESP